MFRENGTFFPMTDEEIIREIRLLLVNLNRIWAHSLNLLMYVNGYLDENKEQMLKDLDDPTPPRGTGILPSFFYKKSALWSGFSIQQFIL